MAYIAPWSPQYDDFLTVQKNFFESQMGEILHWENAP